MASLQTSGRQSSVHSTDSDDSSTIVVIGSGNSTPRQPSEDFTDSDDSSSTVIPTAAGYPSSPFTMSSSSPTPTWPEEHLLRSQSVSLERSLSPYPSNVSTPPDGEDEYTTSSSDQENNPRFSRRRQRPRVVYERNYDEIRYFDNLVSKFFPMPFVILVLISF